MSRALESLWYPTRESLPRALALSPLTVLSAGYGGLMGLRQQLFRSGVLRSERVLGVRVLSVGNLNVGGTGKTPAVIALAERLRTRTLVAVVTRGYGRQSGEPLDIEPGQVRSPLLAGDEPLLISARTGVPVLVDRDRVRATQRARDRYGARVVILDDGMQHLRLARDLDMVVVDEAVGFGNGRVIPRGPLREPLIGLERAGLIWLRESSQPVPLPAFAAPVIRVRYVPSVWIRPDGQTERLDALSGRRVIALCGIARPSRFERTLAELGVERVQTFAFADHHAFKPDELARVRSAAERADATLVTTEKDRVRLPAGFPALALRLEVRVRAGEDVLDRLLAET